MPRTPSLSFANLVGCSAGFGLSGHAAECCRTVWSRPRRWLAGRECLGCECRSLRHFAASASSTDQAEVRRCRREYNEKRILGPYG
eukprot:3931739-Rhodomonas_salina.1